MPGSFFDTNVLVYLIAGDRDKAERTKAILRTGGTVSIQVLNELTNVARRKLRLSWDHTHLLLATVRKAAAVVPLTVDTHEAGLRLAARYSLSIYDAMIVAAASLSGCDTLWSEDMHHGLLIDGSLRIANPFRTV
jgi:predicted nucleic acid-binding protein